MATTTLRFAGTVINTPDPDGLAAFYERLLDWPRLMDEQDWIALRHPDGGTAVAFQRDAAAVRPTWPAERGRQQMLLHLDFTTDDLDAAVQHAIDAGATLAATQTSETERVLLDPAGNPFCIIVTGA